jgi:hypothetical protein
MCSQIGATVIGVFGFGGYDRPREEESYDSCRFCGLSTGGHIPFFNSGIVPQAGTEAAFTASVIGCT